MIYYVYMTINLVNYKKYIGITKNPINSGYIGSGHRMKRAIKKYGKDFFIRHDLFEGTLEEASNMESFYIDYYKASQSHDFYNIRHGGFDGPHGESTKRLISEKRKGMKMKTNKTQRSEHAKKNSVMMGAKSNGQKARNRWSALKKTFSKDPIVSDDMRMMHDYYGVHESIEKLPKEHLQEYLKFRFRFLQEELDEGIKAIEEKDPEEVVDALIDLIVVAAGTLDVYQVDFKKAWYEVLNANMNKEVGVKASRPNPWGLPDLIKRDDWVPPSHKDNHGLLTKTLKD